MAADSQNLERKSFSKSACSSALSPDSRSASKSLKASAALAFICCLPILIPLAYGVWGSSARLKLPSLMVLLLFLALTADVILQHLFNFLQVIG